MPTSSRRALYRIVYPIDERPTFEIGRFVYEVIDCSERGLRYEVKDRRVPALGTPLGGHPRCSGARARRSRSPARSFEHAAAPSSLALDAPGIPFSRHPRRAALPARSRIHACATERRLTRRATTKSAPSSDGALFVGACGAYAAALGLRRLLNQLDVDRDLTSSPTATRPPRAPDSTSDRTRCG